MASWLPQAWAKIAGHWRWFWGIRKAGPNTAASAQGRLGEEAAAKFVQERGWIIVTRNWRHGRDELDLVAWDGDILVFTEVKTRAAHAPVSGYNSVTWRKKRALARAVRAYLRGLEQSPTHFRFDIVEVKVSDGAVLKVLLHSGITLLPNHIPPNRGHGPRY